ncbi:Hypothetical protein RG1141_CH39700 [Neorhizobium galegae bv. officinalis bv. officinalis str. HAMBI 1141]|jgi:hypothetical protein|uniref:Uncharacterized protein n=1 Tax=Neorhizobium galegae bv. officinalis bv. officinalis str. HAMBI 1141 TaxID=1028801 RepID=A0A068TFU6_NEOGA|nr:MULTISPECIES: excalibur calcium-binding domain-containing protein [Neorhizobium]MCJ9669161.1 excalibur calcium-binding domain-containing protein [Neorhizobium sp. SHOUNA12B]MCJ9744429.1 excalibur calcium-binding domain-containing protein [Neorhizobium sp. SHOUNA12A]CDN56290.1 Hypothetical protein RG1141_CH39700 [Neorhizobium galegae bv. officinalis bv. officinalis str. HAMBI 1141]
MKRLTISVLFIAGFAASVAEAKTCKEVDSCEEAVKIWCDGYRRADADKDGIPCENVCRARDQVEEIQSRLGC